MHSAILTGMHRSGTSAITRLVQKLGVNVGSDLLPAAGGNLFGHFEEAAFIRFHDDLIDRLFPKRAPFCEWLPLEDAPMIYTDADRDEARSIWKRHRAAGGNAWKDPRTSLFLDLWLDVLPEAKVVVCLRHPYQVHRSLLRRGEPFLHVDYSASIVGWSIYNQRILRVISALPKSRFLLVDVESALRKPRGLAEGLAHFLEIPCDDAALGMISPESFHFEDENPEALSHFEDFFPEVAALYQQLRQFDFLHPGIPSPMIAGQARPIRSAETSLIAFEESQGLRVTAKKMLIRSIAVDRQRIIDLYQHATRLNDEKDRLIEDLSLLTENLKRHVVELQRQHVRT